MTISAQTCLELLTPSVMPMLINFPLNFPQEILSQFFYFPMNAFVVVECQDGVDKNIMYIVK